MESLLSAHDAACVLVIRMLLRRALAVDDWRRGLHVRAKRLRGSLRKLRRAWLRRLGRAKAARGWRRRRAWNRTPAETEERIVRLHVELPHLGAGQLRHLALRVLGFGTTRETVRRILLRNQAVIAELEEAKHKPPRRIQVRAPGVLWGADLTLIWILGFLPVWVRGVVALEALARPSAAQVSSAMDRAFARHGAPGRLLTDRGSVFRAEVFEALLRSRGVAHTLTRPCHPWTNGRIERLFRTFKETLRRCFRLMRSRAQLERACRDFLLF